MSIEKLGPYTIVDELGTGGMGTVYSADVEGRVPGIDVGTRVALKLVHPHLLETPGFFKRFMREGEVGKSIRHENLVRTYDTDALIQDGTHYHFLVMEFVEGQTLRDLLEELDRVPEELCRHVGREIARALAAIHGANVVHRDLKPENVLITPDQVIKVMDLGVARLQDEAVRLSQTGAFVGSVHYAAPEQFGGGGGVDHRADLHSLGLLLYELGCGQHPYYDEDFRVALKRLLHEEPRRVAEINPQLSPFYEEVVHTLLQKKKEDRFESATELVAILEEGEESEWWEERAKALRVETRQPLRRIRVPRATALYGRDDELEKLRGIYAQVRAGEGRVLLVEGEAGIGKTRLVDEFVGQLRQSGEDLNFLFGSYPPGGAATAAGAFSTAYREHFGEAGLLETLQDYLAVTPSLIPAFAALLQGEATPKGEEALTKDSLQTVFVHATRALAAERPTIVLIDDLHFAPEDGRALFAALALAVPSHEILLVGTMRRGLPEDFVAETERLDHVSRVSLTRLGAKDLFEMLKDSFRSDRLAQELGMQIAVKSDGNPFFAFEIIRGLREGQFITQSEDGSWASTRAISKIEIPSSVMELIEARLMNVADEERELLDVAACCGFEFDPRLVAEVVGMRRIPALRELGKIEKTHRLVRSVGRNFEFDHYQVQETLYAGISEALREEYHGAIAETLEENENAADADPEELDGKLSLQLCEHFLKGQRGKQALRYLPCALAHLEAGYLNDEVVALIDRVLELPRLVSGAARVRLLQRKASRLQVIGRTEEQRRTLDEALALARRGEDVELIVRVELACGRALTSAAQFDEGRALIVEAMESARVAGLRSLEGDAWSALGTILRVQGRYEEARAQYGRNVALAEELDEPSRAVSALSSLAHSYHSQGRFEDARASYERAVAAEAESATNTLGISAVGNLGDVLWRLGRCAEARQRMAEQLERSRETGARHSQGAALANLGALHSTLGATERASEDLDSALALLRETGSPDWAAYVRQEQAQLAERRGDGEEAAQVYAEALVERRLLGVEGEVAETLLTIGRMHLLGEDAGAARTALTEALEISRRLKQPYTLVPAAAYLAMLPGGDVEAARATYADHADGLSHLYDLESRYALWKAGGDAADLAEAHRLLAEFRDHAPDDCKDSMIENVPIHREIWEAWLRGPGAASA